jgi:DNA (cytosine-5)-methyltransferase 1
MVHLDLFSGIGGFSLAVDRVWPNSTHIFCDNDLFCQSVLKKHWPNSTIYGDIKQLNPETADIVTGGFPCQPFSAAGRRRGTEDDRYLWPEMLRVIRLAKPAWVIGENVGGLTNWNNGMVLERVCTDLEDENYSVQPFIIPACAVQAPHRRDRIWIVAHTNSQNVERGKLSQESNGVKVRAIPFSEVWKTREGLLPEAVLCRTDDGISRRVDRTKSLGNAIVPQVATQIMLTIKQIYEK